MAGIKLPLPMHIQIPICKTYGNIDSGVNKILSTINENNISRS